MNTWLTIPCVLLIHIGWSQEPILEDIKRTVTAESAQAHIEFLASDKLRGRGTGTPEIDLAADYLAQQFKTHGIKSIAGAPNYFQPVEMLRPAAPSSIGLKIRDESFEYIEDLLMLKGSNLSIEGDIVFVGYGDETDLENLELKGKIVVALTGTSEHNTGNTYTSDDLRNKQLRVKARGAVALIEILTFEEIQWSLLADYLIDKSTEITLMDEPEYIPHFWMKDSDSEVIKQLMRKGNASGGLTIEIPEPQLFSDNNVIGWIEGSDPELKDEYLVLSAHYDHLGTYKNESTDSIFNGARDNAIGVAAILLSGELLVKHPPKRSVMLLAPCAEEVDLLGSKWYVEHPLVPLHQTVYNLNCDGAGYNDKKLMTIIDLERTTTDSHITMAAKTFGLKLVGDPEPFEDLYENSDNYNFALVGIPSVDIAPGVKKFNRKLMKYYHEPNDEFESLDFKYLAKFFRAFVYSAYLIANAQETPSWKPGDEFEEIGKKLYGSH
ncbi:MAG: M28 family peptidase [Cyclobacteriaceae bacterium]